MKKLQPKEEIIPKELLDPVDFQYRGGWHQKRNYDYTTVAGVICGCGLVQMHGVTNLSNIKLKKIINDYKKDGAGAIICTLGEYYYEYEQNIIDLGFILLKEYNNYRHGADAKQRLYILTY